MINLNKDIKVVLSIKQKMIYAMVKKLYKEIQTPKTIFTKDWLKDTLKQTQSELYKLFPDRLFGQLSFSCFDSEFKITNEFGECIYYVDISFHDRYTKIPWLICRFYKQNAKVRFYLET